jgi:Nif-specific regulatory protein
VNTPQPDFAGTSVELDRLLLERDFYLKLLNLGGCDDPDVFLREALSLISGLTGAEKSYIELRSTNEGEDDVCHLQFGLSEEELSAVQNQISTGIIAEALATGQTIVTPAALLDPRFSQFDSVQLGRIGAVICAPIGPSDRLGVLYLHTTRNGHTFSDADRKPVELFARHLAPLAERLLSRLALRKTDDPTAQYRKQLRADDLIGRSHALASVLHEVSLIAPLELSVLITGPTGTGKSQLAEIIHNSSRRSGGPFVVVNCATLPPALAESELFGYERQAPGSSRWHAFSRRDRRTAA